MLVSGLLRSLGVHSVSSPSAHSKINEVYRSGLNLPGCEINLSQPAETSGQGTAHFEGEEQGPFGQSWKNDPPLPKKRQDESQRWTSTGPSLESGMWRLAAVTGSTWSDTTLKHTWINPDRKDILRKMGLNIDRKGRILNPQDFEGIKWSGPSNEPPMMATEDSTTFLGPEGQAD